MRFLPLLLILVTSSANAIGRPRPRPDIPIRCEPRGSWTSVDTTQSSRAHFSAHAVGGDAINLFVAGGTSADLGNPFNFDTALVRRSTDQGKTWTTVDSFSPGPYTVATALAVDQGKGWVYVGGVTGSGSENALSWFIRRSADGGVTWKTVDTFLPDAGANHIRLKDMAIDGLGRVYAVGGRTSFSSGVEMRGIVRRSADFGASWETVRNHVGRLSVQTVVAFNDGRVAVSGRGVDSTAGPFTFVHTSMDGKNAWVDDEAMQFEGGVMDWHDSAIVSQDGTMAIAGDFFPSSAWWQMVGFQLNPWSGGPSKIFGRLPSAPTGPLNMARAWATTVSPGGRVYLAGQGNESEWLVRAGRVATDAFPVSDSFKGDPIAGDWSYARGAYTAVSGDVYVVGQILEGFRSKWLVRKQTCR